MVLTNRKSKNGDLLECDGPYDGFAMFSNITIDDAGVKKVTWNTGSYSTAVMPEMVPGSENRTLLHHSFRRHRFGSQKRSPRPPEVAQKCPKALPGGSLGTPRDGSGSSKDL